MAPTPPRHRSRRLAVLLGGALLLLLAVASARAVLPPGASSAPAAVASTSPPPGNPALAVSVAGGASGPAVPARFLGLSFEVQSVPDLARFSTTGNLPLLLRSLGPSVLRLGGVTADSRVAFADPPNPPPDWAGTTISSADLLGLAALARTGDARVLLTVSLAHDDPGAAAVEAAAAQRALGPSLLGIEIGNEPDAYGRHGVRPQPWTFAQYAPEVDAYRAAIAAVAPGLALAGPDTTGAAFATWGPSEARVERPALLTAHRYPLVCSGVPVPSIAGLLSAATRARDIAQLRSDISIADAARIPLRIDETNSVSCGGRAGVSNTFASALWAVRLISEAMQLGIAGVNFHDLPASCTGYSPLCANGAAALAAGQLSAAPEWYGLLLMRSLVGLRPVAATVSPASPAVTAAAFRGQGLVRIVLVDSDPGGATRPIRIAVGSSRVTASVLALTAPSLAATAGVRLGGGAVNARGELLGPLRRTFVHSAHATVTVPLAPASAALVTLTSGP
jgi:hypothetical protein